MDNNRNVVNVKKLIHENCESRVSQKAIEELSERIIDKLYDMAPELDRIAKKNGRTTIMDEDVIEYLGYVGRDVI